MGSSGPKLSKRLGCRHPGSARNMCNSLPLRASHLWPVDDATSVVEGLRLRGELTAIFF